MAKSGRLELGDIYGYYKSIFNHCDIFGEQIAIEFGEKRKRA